MSDDMPIYEWSRRELAIGIAVHLLCCVVAVVGHEWCRSSGGDNNWHAEYHDVFLAVFACLGVGQLFCVAAGIAGIIGLQLIAIFTTPATSEGKTEMTTLIAWSRKALLGIPGLSLLISSIVYLWPVWHSLL